MPSPLLTLNCVRMRSSRREIFNTLCSVAAEIYPAEEARQIAELILEQCGGVTRNQLLVEPNVELDIPNFDTILSDIRRWRPVQYITGKATFADIDLAVSEGVLVPRPETEELVMRVAAEVSAGATILDVCTGSGCIAIALARCVKDSRVWGLDLSHECLNIARLNGERYAPDVQFVEGDALSDFSQLFDEKFDVIVSNPPYIPVSDMSLMRPNVTEYEPHMALFVPDDDPLKFYRAIACTARQMLKAEGRLYFEIYEMLACEMCDMLRAEGYDDVVLIEDFRGKPRMICAKVSSIAR